MRYLIAIIALSALLALSGCYGIACSILAPEYGKHNCWDTELPA